MFMILIITVMLFCGCMTLFFLHLGPPLILALAKVVDNKHEQDTKQHCSNYQNHKHGEESSMLILAPTTMFLQYNRRLLPMVGVR